MLTAPIPAVYNETAQAIMLKSMVLDPEQFDSN